ncbi:MAG: GNAT family N-acetyltransferase, partial [Nitrososphaerales archaeon]
VRHHRVVPELRPMLETDAVDAVRLWEHAYRTMATEYGLPNHPASEEDVGRLTRRVCHFLATDSGGSWVADDGGGMVGFSQATVRDGYWMLSLLATDPAHQGRGIGRALLERALAHGRPGAPGTIQSSRDPSAMALYSSAGFALHPAVIADGVPRTPPPPHPGVRVGGLGDLGLVDDVDRARRGSTRRKDIERMLGEPGNRLLVHERGYAVAQDARLVTLGALDEPSAEALLRSALASARGNFEVGWITSSQQWAIRTLVDAGIDLHPYGAVMVRGTPGPPTPYIPSGGYG